MTERERLLEEFDDAYFALLMEGVARKEGEQLEGLNEMLQDNPEAAVPERVDKRCLETIDRHFAREHRKIGLRKTGKVLRLAAIIMGISMLLFTTAFAVSEEFRVATLNLVRTITEEYTQLDIRELNGGRSQRTHDPKSEFEYFHNIDIQWLPEDFAYTEGEYDWYANFEKENGEWIKILIYDGHGSLNVDTENADSVENIAINGNEGLCIFKDDYIHVVTTDLKNNIYIDVIASNELPEDDVKKFVENIFVL